MLLLYRKRCSSCKKIKDQKYYSYDSNSLDRLQSKCKVCAKNSKLKTRYDITIIEYERIFKRQGGACAICRIKQSGFTSAFCVDHDHDTNAIRGILCPCCNRGLGLLGDSIRMITRALAYLKRSK